MALPEQYSVPFLEESARVESGFNKPHNESDELPSKLVIGSYNIRYGVGQFLISTGLLRKVGFNLPRRRAAVVAENVRAAATAFSKGKLCPPLDILALQEADKSTVRAGGHHIAREL